MMTPARFLVLCFTFPSVFGGFFSTSPFDKPGTCPPVSAPATQSSWFGSSPFCQFNGCFSDFFCPGQQKCCGCPKACIDIPVARSPATTKLPQAPQVTAKATRRRMPPIKTNSHRRFPTSRTSRTRPGGSLSHNPSPTILASRSTRHPRAKPTTPAATRPPRTRPTMPASTRPPRTRPTSPASTKRPRTRPASPASTRQPRTRPATPASTRPTMPTSRRLPRTRPTAPVSTRLPETRPNMPASTRPPRSRLLLSTSTLQPAPRTRRTRPPTSALPQTVRTNRLPVETTTRRMPATTPTTSTILRQDEPVTTNPSAETKTMASATCPPPVFPPGFCDRAQLIDLCDNNSECEANEICCQSVCGVRHCVKIGCAPPSFPEGICERARITNLCNSDEECTGNGEICCPAFCGARECVQRI